MTSPELENLVKIGQLKREPPAAGEPTPTSRSRAASISLTTRRTLLRWRCAVWAIAPQTAISFFRPCLTRAVCRLRRGGCWLGPRKPQPRGIRGLLSVDERLVDDMIAAATTVLTARCALWVPGPSEVRTCSNT